MTTKSLEAFVIHKQWSGDTSARLVLFTQELGLIHCLCQGGRTPKKQSLLQAFTPLWVAIDERYDRFYTKSIEATAPSIALQGPALFSALYLNELIYYAFKPSDPYPLLFQAYTQVLSHLSTAPDRLIIESLLRRFEWALLNACGYFFSLSHDIEGSEIQVDYHYRFIAGEGFMLSKQGFLGEHLLALAQDKLQDPAHLKSAKMIMRQAIDHLLGGREIKSRALYLMN